MSSDVEVIYALNVNIEDATTQIRQLERLLFRSISLLKRMGLPEDATEFLIKVQRMISALRMLRISLTAMQAAAGPVGWVTALMGLTIGAMEGGELLTDIASEAKQSWRPTI